MRARDVGGLLEGLLGLTETHEQELGPYGEEPADLVAAIIAIRQPVEQCALLVIEPRRPGLPATTVFSRMTC